RSAYRTLGRSLVTPGPQGSISSIPEWELYREINVEFLQAEEVTLRRPLSTREATYRLRQAMSQDANRFPAIRLLGKLRNAVAERGDLLADEDDDEKAGFAESELLVGSGGLIGGSGPGAGRLDRFVERRFLNSCRSACPSCLQDQDCEVDQSLFGALLLD